ncbi:MAG: hypothetical protein RIR18_883 [Pseudomonadota bacterium]
MNSFRTIAAFTVAVGLVLSPLSAYAQPHKKHQAKHHHVKKHHAKVKKSADASPIVAPVQN